MLADTVPARGGASLPDQTAGATASALEAEVLGLLGQGGGVVVDTSGAGLGKSFATWELVGRLLLADVTVEYLVPTRALRGEAATLARSMSIPVVELPGLGEEAATWRGGGCVDPEGVARARAAHPAGQAEHCGACPYRERCPLIAARKVGFSPASNAVLLTTSAGWSLRGPRPMRVGERRVTVVDERVWHLATRTFTLSLAQLQALKRDGVAATSHLVDALGASALRDKGREVAGWTLEDVAAVDDGTVGDLLRVDLDAVSFHAGRAWAAREAGVGDPGSWEGLVALRELARAGELGRCWVSHGALVVPAARALPQPRTGEVLLCLDATASLHVAALLWPRVRMVTVSRAPLQRPRLLHLAVKTSVERGGSKESRAATLAGRAATLAGRLAAAGALGFAPRADLLDAQHPLHVEGGGQWLYHAGPQGRGSNVHAHERRAVLLPYHVPRAQVELVAEQWRRGDPGPLDMERVTLEDGRREWLRVGALGEAWGAEAREQLVDAELYQEAHRLRGLRESGRELVFIGGHVPRWLRDECDVVALDRDTSEAAVWAWQGGRLSACLSACEEAIAAAVAVHGGVWCPSVQPWTVGVARAAVAGRLPAVLREVLPPLASCPLDSTPLYDALGAHWASRHVGEGLVVREVLGPKGRVRVVCDAARSGADVHALQALLWPTWARERLDVAALLRDLADALRAKGRAPTWGELVGASGVARSTWRARLKSAGLPSELGAALSAAAGVGGEGDRVLPNAPCEALSLERLAAPRHPPRELQPTAPSAPPRAPDAPTSPPPPLSLERLAAPCHPRAPDAPTPPPPSLERLAAPCHPRAPDAPTPPPPSLERLAAPRHPFEPDAPTPPRPDLRAPDAPTPPRSAPLKAPPQARTQSGLGKGTRGRGRSKGRKGEPPTPEPLDYIGRQIWPGAPWAAR